MIRIDSEWDFGYGDMVFDSIEEAKEHMLNDPNVVEVCEDNESTLEDLIANGLINFTRLTRLQR